MDLPFHNHPAYNRVHRRSASPLTRVFVGRGATRAHRQQCGRIGPEGAALRPLATTAARWASRARDQIVLRRPRRRPVPAPTTAGAAKVCGEPLWRFVSRAVLSHFQLDILQCTL